MFMPHCKMSLHCEYKRLHSIFISFRCQEKGMQFNHFHTLPKCSTSVLADDMNCTMQRTWDISVITKNLSPCAVQ